MPYDDFEYTSVRIKPKQKKVEVELAVDTKSTHYAKGKGEQIALNVDGHSTENRTFMSDVMDRQMLSSMTTVESMAQYAVGILKGGELHLTPLHSIIQLRPSFGYLDKADSRGKQDKMEVDGTDSQDEEDAKPVTVKMVRPETDQARARRLASYEYHEQKMAEEQWIHVHHRPIDDVLSEREREQLYCQSVDNEINQLVLPPKEYLSSLIPEPEEDKLAKPKMPVNILSMSQLKTMTLPDQVRALLINAKVIRFSQLMTILPGSYDQSSVLKALQTVALLVQGTWVVKSEVLYPKDTSSPISGVSSEILCRGRDYVMWRFTQSRCVVRKEVASVTKLQAEDTKEILEQMARPRVNQGWEFLLEPDKDFVDRHADVAQRQHMIWQAKLQQFSKVLKIPKHETEKKGKGKDPVEMSTGPERVKGSRSRTRSKSSSMSDSSPTKATSISNTDHSNHVIDVDNFRPSEPSRIPTMSSLDAGNHALTNSVGEAGHATGRRRSSSASYPKLGSPAPQGQGDLRTELMSFLNEIFKEHAILSISQMRKLLMGRLTESPPGHVLGSGVTDKLLEESAVDIGCTLLQVPWPAQYKEVADKRLFCRTALGDAHDKFRGVILDLFRENFKLKKTLILEQCKELLGVDLSSKAEFDRILKSVCVFKSPYWYLKGTIPTT
ncbi:DNA-directed RNA polymerase III subunit RPC5-like [Diadema antillarum]|uniref:DNA-directed RNA polymerase III subunit RPC5-like n=1 Tax=Diadema antillarum TaxID=105358 RepID=UPI003A875258